MRLDPKQGAGHAQSDPKCRSTAASREWRENRRPAGQGRSLVAIQGLVGPKNFATSGKPRTDTSVSKVGPKPTRSDGEHRSGCPGKLRGSDAVPASTLRFIEGLVGSPHQCRCISRIVLRRIEGHDAEGNARREQRKW